MTATQPVTPPPRESGPPAATEFRMPSLGADMQAGTVVAWLAKPGDTVKRGDVVAEVETEKGVFEVEITQGGTIAELVVAQGTKVPVGTVLARLTPTEGSAPVAPPAPPPVSPVIAAPAEAPIVMPEAVPTPTPPPVAPPEHPPRVSPLARRVAAEMHVDLAHVVGTGADGAITRADVERAAAGAPGSTAATAPPPVAAPQPPVADIMPAMRRAVATAVAKSKREIPHYYLGTEIDLGSALGWLATQNQLRPVADRILPAALLLKSVALALRKYPDLNGFWTEGAFQPAANVHLGIAISLRGGGLIAPAIHDADRLAIGDLMHALADLVRRARSGGLRSSEMMDATVTVSNLGDEGVTSVFGVIYPPQVALVGFGRIVERPWAEGGMLGVRPIVTATLAADHRATDGHYGGRFLAEVDRLLHAPEAL